jgi:hypothetical protein
LLKQHHIYWKQRGTIIWVKLGNASNKFFHANTTLKFRRNLITYLEDDNVSSVSDHQAKAISSRVF